MIDNRVDLPIGVVFGRGLEIDQRVPFGQLPRLLFPHLPLFSQILLIPYENYLTLLQRVLLDFPQPGLN